MKTTIITACIAAAFVLAFFSCGLFGSEKKTPAFTVQGEWTLDSIENKGSDSSTNIGLMLFAMTHDSIPPSFVFGKDSSFRFLSATDTLESSYYVSADQKSIFVKDDSAYMQLNLLQTSDSAFTAATTDSVVYYLKRK